MQALWRQNLGWDETISDQLFGRWTHIFNGLSALNDVRISRWTGFNGGDCRVELHGFADASNSAYAAVVYCKIISSTDQPTVSLLAGKSKVAPIKPCSIPRLELSAAVLLARLIEFTSSSLSITKSVCYCWSDSTVVLTWIANHPSKWKVFVANRVSDIQTRIPNGKWRYVPTQDNPADCASRGLIGNELLDHPVWWHGPSWLMLSEAHWPRNHTCGTEDHNLEERPVTTLSSHVIQPWELFSHISNWPKLIRVTAYVLRFISACRRDHRHPPRQPTLGRALNADKCARSRVRLIKLLQGSMFSADITSLQRNKPLPNKSHILSLAPFLDKDGILRVGGRIVRSPLPFPRRHPILLASHRVTNLIITNSHIRSLHAGVQLTLNVLRGEFWIIRARSLVRNQIHKCIACVRERAAIPTQLMGDLPSARVTAPPRPFINCGIDYAGPVLVRATSGRGIASRKAYISVFVCLATRAIHLELVSDYSSHSFINAFHRFTSRRGIPNVIFSDHGTTFVGASNELAASYRAAICNPEFQNQTATEGITWKFIPPAAPHFGGIWEAGVKSVKHHMRRVLKSHTLTFEELSTLLCRIEACLNSRPIAPLSDTLDDYEHLTPGHFLIGSSIMTYPEPSLLDVHETRLTRWQLVRQMTERFWKLWYSDYLNALQQRSKWRRTQPPLKEGQLVLIRNATLPPSKWELGRVIRIHPGSDGLIRVVTVRTASSELTRPIAKLCVLPIDCAGIEASKENDEVC